MPRQYANGEKPAIEMTGQLRLMQAASSPTQFVYPRLPSALLLLLLLPILLFVLLFDILVVPTSACMN